jgi:RNA polymerase sigma-70 factor (sigma-E family)
MGAAADEDFVAFVRSRQRSLLRAAYLVCGDAQHAEDLVQEAFVKLGSRWESVQHGSPDAYVRRIIYHDAVTRWRRWRREVVHDVTATDGAWTGLVEPDPTESWVSGADVREALRELPPRQRAVIVLRYYEDLSEEAIAEALGISRGTVKSQASGALRNLRGLLPHLAPALTSDGGELA